MLALVFGRHLLYVLLVALVSAAALGIVWQGLRGRSDRPWAYAAWMASTTATLFLTLWFKTVSTGAVSCTVSKDLWEAFGTTQGWMNVALFVPIGFFGVRAARRPMPPLLLSVLLACGIETIQAVFPVIGRYCDTSDLITNAAGAAAGVGSGVLSLRLAGSQLSPWPTRRRWFPVATGAGFTAVACLMTTAVDLRVVDHAEPSRQASAAQQTVIGQAVHKALGDDFKIVRVMDSTPCGLDGVDEQVWADLKPTGTASMSWPHPDRFQINVSVASRTEGMPAGYPIPGSARSVHDAASAARAAGRYVAAHYPTADAKRPVVDRADAGAGGTWTVTYPYRGDRMLAVTSLKVTVNAAGQLLEVDLSAVTGSGSDPKERSENRGRAESSGPLACLSGG
ncbi:VanZ family protein [Streptomyces sp. NPDC047009]|uniref:VanZ family protein n=1 Tax=Streptomyces sp. NPDC047009 TaxID=3154496 RepID=UPI00340EED3C